ncbi:YciI family protein [soil metagenome]
MRYACLIYTNHNTDPSEGDPEAQEVYNAYMAFGEKWSGVIRGGEALLPIGTATSVRVRNGETLVTDGPFAETKEHLGGFYIIEADDLDKAIETAKDIPGASTGTVEVRPVMEFE